MESSWDTPFSHRTRTGPVDRSSSHHHPVQRLVSVYANPRNLRSFEKRLIPISVCACGASAKCDGLRKALASGTCHWYG